MITYIFGKTRSGKSYKAVTLILKELKERPVLGSIQLTKFLPGYTFLDSVKMSKMLADIEDIYTEAKQDLTSEEIIYKKLREKDLGDCAIFIDEAHIYGFGDSRRKDFLMFFLALQGHIGINIYLITQTKKQLHSVFHDLGDVVISCIPPTERAVDGVLEYRFFSHVNMIGKASEAYKNEKVIAKKDIFALYKSGDINKGDPAYRRKLYLILAGTLVAVLFTVYQFKSLFSKGDHTVDTKIQNVSDINYSSVRFNKSLSKVTPSKYLYLTCISNECKNQRYAISLNVDDLEALLKDTDSKFLRSSQINKNIANVYLLASPAFLGLFKNRSYKNEKGFNLLH